mgnify:CR=1 FL=1
MIAIKTAFILLGPHGAGKSSLGHALAQTTSIPFHHEIGNELRLGTTVPVDAGQPDFDEEVFRRELERDECILQSTSSSCLIESWHIGNVCFALARGSVGALQVHRLAISREFSRFRVAPIRLQLTKDEFLRRCSEQERSAAEAWAFYRRFSGHLSRLLLEVKPVIADLLELPPDIGLAEAVQMSVDWMSRVERSVT